MRTERGKVPRSVRNLHRVVSSILLSGNADTLGFGCRRETGVGHHVMDGVARLGDDHLQVDRRLVAVGDGEGSGAIRVHNVSAGVRGPAGRDVAVNGDRVELGQVSFAIVGSSRKAINGQGRAIGKENLPVDREGVGALDGGIGATGAGRQG